MQSLPPLVLKIGGSLAASDRARDVLNLAVASRRRIVIVPGGGAYADAVRADQAVHGFSDSEAHKRAVLAMHRMGDDFIGLHPKLKPAQSLKDMGQALDAGVVPVWRPWTMIEHEATIPQDWTMTSDGLAAWLASQMPGGAAVVLVKSCTVPAGGASVQVLGAAGITDPQFARIVTQSHLEWHVLGPDHDVRLALLMG